MQLKNNVLMMKQVMIILISSCLTLSTFACYCDLNPLTIEALSGYKFISVVKIKKLSNVELNDKSIGYYQIADVETLENFKGKVFDKIMITSVRSSCDIGVREGDVWIFFANELKGEAAVFPCGHSTNFLSQDKVVTHLYWNYPSGIGTLNFLRNHFIKFPIDGLANGKWLNGNPSYTLTKMENKLNGELVMYDEDGKRIAAYAYKDSLLLGESIIWYKNGQVHSKSNYNNGKLEGKVFEYLLNGKKISETNYVQGKFDGLRKEWDEFGNIIFEGRYKERKIRDTAFCWYKIDTSRLGARMYPMSLFDKVNADSVYEWNKRRQINYIIINDSSGKLIHNVSYFRNGNLERETVYEPNSKYYIAHEYHFNGITKEYRIYWLEGKGEFGNDEIRYLYEEICFGDDGKKIRKRFFDKEGKKIIKVIDIENGKETIVFAKEK
jgi:antitoxin component YwqK of YwqJK toxin-antitoxin module